MGVFYETIPDSQLEWVRAQKMFWVATAPLSGNGHVNVSPKGGPYFGIVDEKTFWYMDLTGSGIETIAHLHEPGNGRITIMFNAFDGAPKILRFWGKGRVLENGSADFEEFVCKNEVKTIPGTRSIIVVDIHQVGGSCGFSVPLYDFKEHRQVLNDHFAKKQKRYESGKEEDSIDKYWAYKSAWSMDGLPGMKRGLTAGRQHKIVPIKKMVGPLAPTKYRKSFYTFQDLILVAILFMLIGFLGATYGPRVAEQCRGLISADLKVPTPFPSLAEWR